MEDQAIKAKKRFNIKLALTILAILGLLSGNVWYYYQTTQLTNDKHKLDTAKTELQKTNDTQSAKIKELETKVADQGKQLTELQAPVQATLMVSGVSGMQFLPSSSSAYALISLSVKNTSSQIGCISTSSFRLKGNNDKSYPQAYPPYLPDGLIGLQSQQINPGETIKGTLAFTVEKNTSLTLIYDGESFPIAISW